MNYVEWTLDLEEEIDPRDPLGTIKIMGDEGYIEDKCTYLNNYFEAILLGIQSMKKGQIVSIDPIIEPDCIEFDYTNDFLLLSYAKQQTKVINVEKFISDVQQSICDLLDVLDAAPVREGKTRPNFEILRKFVRNNL